jgi:hypothetical protein
MLIFCAKSTYQEDSLCSQKVIVKINVIVVHLKYICTERAELARDARPREMRINTSSKHTRTAQIS